MKRLVSTPPYPAAAPLLNESEGRLSALGDAEGWTYIPVAVMGRQSLIESPEDPETLRDGYRHVGASVVQIHPTGPH